MLQTFKKRIYVGGLANDVTAAEIQERFSKFGKVSNLSLKRRTDEFGGLTNFDNKVKSFCHLDLEGDEVNIKKCFSTYQNTKWKGSVLQLQFAKESFLQKLEKERAEAKHQKEDIPEVKPPPTSQKPPSELFEVKGPAVPGTPVPGKNDWIVGKYGRVLPVLKLKKSYKIKMVKYDPSKHCHAVKVFKEENTTVPSSSDCLTWEINTPDNEITRKRKGEFPDVSNSSKKTKGTFPSQNKTTTNIQQYLLAKEKENEELEFVKIGSGSNNMVTKLNKSNKFDSDIESDSEDASVPNISLGDPHPMGKVTSNTKLSNKGDNQNTESPGRNSNKVPCKSANDIKSKSTPESSKKNDYKTGSTSNMVSTTSKEVTPKTEQNKLSMAATTFKELTPKIEQNKLSAKTAPGPGRNVPTDFKKIPEFKGLGMLGQSSNVGEAKSVSVADDVFNKSKKNVLLNKVTKDADSDDVDNSNTKLISPRGLNAKIKSASPSKVSRVSTLSSASDGIGNSASKVTSFISSGLKQKSHKQLSQKSTNANHLPETSLKQNLFPQKSSQSLSNILAASNSALAESDSKDYDSSSSADTDEIIARCKRKKGFIKESGAETTPGIPCASSTPANYLLPSETVFAKKLNSSFIDHSLGLSEFAAEMVENPGHSPTAVSPLNHSDSYDSYDSDLDSNDFELVVKKLAQKAMSSKTEVATKKGLHETNKFVRVVQDSSKTESKNKKEMKVLATAGRETNDHVTPASIKALMPNQAAVETSKDKTKHKADNEKRLQAIKENMKLKQKQISISQTALRNVDSQDGTSSKRIVFSSSSDDESSEAQDNDDDNDSPNRNVTPRVKERSRKDLFDSQDEDDDVDEIFKSKPHFEGKKGEKLMRLQQKIADPRFKLDAKFVYSDSDDQDDEDQGKSLETDKSFDEEKSANLKVLENVIGKTTLDRFTEKLKRNTKNIIDMNAVRFDPTKPQTKTGTVPGINKAILPNTIIASSENMKAKPSGVTTVLKEQQTKNKTDDKVKTYNQRSEKENKISKIESDKKQSQPSDKKTDNEIKLDKLQIKSTEKSGKTSKNSKIQVSTSLVDIFKKKSDSGSKTEDTGTFYLLQQFDEAEEDMEDSDDGGKHKKNEKDSEPLSALFKKEADKSGLNSKNKPSSKPGSSQPKDFTSADIKRSSHDVSDENNDDEEEEMKVTKIAEQTQKKLPTVRNIQIEIMKKREKGVPLPIDDEDKEALDDDSSENESSNQNDKSQTTYGSNDDNEMDLFNSGQTDVRYTKEQWLTRWEEIRPTLVKMYKRKHKDAMRNKRKVNEIKRKKSFLKNSKRNRWARTGVS